MRVIVFTKRQLRQVLLGFDGVYFNAFARALKYTSNLKTAHDSAIKDCEGYLAHTGEDFEDISYGTYGDGTYGDGVPYGDDKEHIDYISHSGNRYVISNSSRTGYYDFYLPADSSMRSWAEAVKDGATHIDG